MDYFATKLQLSPPPSLTECRPLPLVSACRQAIYWATLRTIKQARKGTAKLQLASVNATQKPPARRQKCKIISQNQPFPQLTDIQRDSKTGHFALRNGPFRRVKRAVLEAKTGRFANVAAPTVASPRPAMPCEPARHSHDQAPSPHLTGHRRLHRKAHNCMPKAKVCILFQTSNIFIKFASDNRNNTRARHNARNQSIKSDNEKKHSRDTGRRRRQASWAVHAETILQSGRQDGG